MITLEDLIEAGWQRSEEIGKLIAAAREFEQRGICEKSYIIKLLKRDFGEPEKRIRPRTEPLQWAEAIKATCKEDEKNLGAVRRYMGQLMKVPVIEAGSIMPDCCPAGSSEATIPVGGAIAVKNAIIPSAHSADICCSMHATVFSCEKPISEMLDALVDSTRFGPGGRAKDQLVDDPVIHEDVWQNKFLSGLKNHAVIHMADQGDGNHFAYIGEWIITSTLLETLKEQGLTDLADHLNKSEGQTRQVLVTHHGSRGLGAQVYKRGQKRAVRETEKIADNIPKAAAWLDYDTDLGKEYWQALQYVSRWTKANHRAIHKRFLERAEATAFAEFGNEHNFVWKRGDQFLHGKGATPAWNDDQGRPLLGLIPLNMGAPILVVLGKDNEDYLSFAPHGAGRNLSRTALKRQYLGRKDFNNQEMIDQLVEENTQGLDIRWYNGKADLSESPIAYKPANQVKAQINEFGLAEVVGEIRPLGCIMAGDGGIPPWKQREKELTPKQKRQIEHRADRRKTRQKYRNLDDDLDDVF